MPINRTNYESYFLDFLEGRLPEREVDELMAFLKINPDLEDSLISFDNYTIESKGDVAIDKQFLFKSLENFETINESNFDEFCIAWYENELSENSSGAFSEYLIANPAKTKDFEAYGKAFLKPDLNIRFPHKSRLKKYAVSRIYRLSYLATAVAAAIIIFFYLFPINNNSYQKTAPEIAVNSPVISPQIQNSSSFSTTTHSLKTKPHSKVRVSNIKNRRSNLFQTVPSSQPDSNSSEIINIAFLDMLKINFIDRQIVSDNIAILELSQKNTPLAGSSEYPNLREFAVNEIKKFRNSNSAGTERNSDLTFWDIAKLGVSGINNITGSNIKLNRTIDDKGKITAMAIQSGSLGFSRSISK